MRPSTATTFSGYPSWVVALMARGDLSTLTDASKIRKATASPLRTRPVQTAFLDTTADGLARCMSSLLERTLGADSGAPRESAGPEESGLPSLPHHGHQAMTDPLPVFRVAREIPRQDSLLVEKPPEQERRHRGERQKAPVGAERERRAEHVEHSPR